MIFTLNRVIAFAENNGKAFTPFFYIPPSVIRETGYFFVFSKLPLFRLALYLRNSVFWLRKFLHFECSKNHVLETNVTKRRRIKHHVDYQNYHNARKWRSWGHNACKLPAILNLTLINALVTVKTRRSASVKNPARTSLSRRESYLDLGKLVWFRYIQVETFNFHWVILSNHKVFHSTHNGSIKANRKNEKSQLVNQPRTLLLIAHNKNHTGCIYVFFFLRSHARINPKLL